MTFVSQLTHERYGWPRHGGIIYYLSVSVRSVGCPRMQPQEVPPAQEPAQPPPPQQQRQPQQEAPPPAGNIGLDRSMSLRRIDPLQLVKSPMPLLSADQKKAPERALGQLEDAAARDETCVWQRVSTCMFPCIVANPILPIKVKVCLRREMKVCLRFTCLQVSVQGVATGKYSRKTGQDCPSQ